MFLPLPSTVAADVPKHNHEDKSRHALMGLPLSKHNHKHNHKHTPLYKQKYKHKVMDLPLPMSKHNHKLMPKQQLRHRHLSPRLDHVCVFAYTHTSSTDMIFRQAVFRHAKEYKHSPRLHHCHRVCISQHT